MNEQTFSKLKLEFEHNITEKDRSFVLGGKVSIEDVIVSKHIFEKGADEYVAANT